MTDQTTEQGAIRDVLAGWPIGSGYYQSQVGVDEASEMAEAVMVEVERIVAERRCADRCEAEKGPELRAALNYLVTMAFGHDYADATKIHDAEWLIEDALFRPATSRSDTP